MIMSIIHIPLCSFTSTNMKHHVLLFQIFTLLLFKQSWAEKCVVTKFEQVEIATKRCTDIVIKDLHVPAGVTLKLVLLKGTHLTFSGNTSFGYKKDWNGPLVTLNGTNLYVKGESGALFDGQGERYWDGKGGEGKPQMFTFEAFNSRFTRFYILNSPKDVLQVTNSDNVEFDDWYIDNRAGDKGRAPAGHENHNSDGFDVWNSTNVVIRDSTVFNQDDCVALRCGENITVYNMWCEGGHGLSLSVGFSKTDISLNTLKNVTIRNSYVVDGANGIHIKTHNDGGPGLITDVTYQTIIFSGADTNGIQIHQNYPKGEVVGNVPIRNLNFILVNGQVEEKAYPVFILCAKEGCSNWNWTDVTVIGGKNSSCNFEPNGYTC